jgi:hypothetical protein
MYTCTLHEREGAREGARERDLAHKGGLLELLLEAGPPHLHVEDVRVNHVKRQRTTPEENLLALRGESALIASTIYFPPTCHIPPSPFPIPEVFFTMKGRTGIWKKVTTKPYQMECYPPPPHRYACMRLSPPQ